MSRADTPKNEPGVGAAKREREAREKRAEARRRAAGGFMVGVGGENTCAREGKVRPKCRQRWQYC